MMLVSRSRGCEKGQVYKPPAARMQRYVSFNLHPLRSTYLDHVAAGSGGSFLWLHIFFSSLLPGLHSFLLSSYGFPNTGIPPNCRTKKKSITTAASMSSSALVLLALLSPLAHAAVPSIEGFTLVFSDDFTGAAGNLPDSANWIFTTGTSYPGGAPQFGTWEIETYTANPENVQTDGQGNRKWLASSLQTREVYVVLKSSPAVRITAIKTGESWTSSRIETQRTDFMAPDGGKMRIQASLNLPKVAQPIGYWPAFWTLGAKFRGVFT